MEKIIDKVWWKQIDAIKIAQKGLISYLNWSYDMMRVAKDYEGGDHEGTRQRQQRTMVYLGWFPGDDG
jgi:hypothetical protein